MIHKDDDGVPRSTMNTLFQTPANEYQACIQRHERVRIAMLVLAVVAIFLSDVLFFTMQTILPLLAITILSILLYTYVNKRLRSVEKQLSLRTPA